MKNIRNKTKYKSRMLTSVSWRVFLVRNNHYIMKLLPNLNFFHYHCMNIDILQAK